MKAEILKIFSGLTQKSNISTNNEDILTKFRRHFLIPDVISNNKEFKAFLEGITNFSGNQVSDGKDVIFVGNLEKRRGMANLVFKLSALRGIDEKYKITFSKDNNIGQPYIHLFNKICFQNMVQKKDGLPIKNITAVQKYYDDNICVDYYETAVYETKSNWVAKDIVFSNDSENSFNHFVISKDDENHGYRVQNLNTKSKLVDIKKITGFEIRGETIFGKTGENLSKDDIIHIFRTVEEFNQFKGEKPKIELSAIK